MFKKHKNNQNRNKPLGKKQKILTTIALTLSLLFGKSRLSSFQSSSPNFSSQEGHQRIKDNQEFNLIEGNDQQVILTKARSKGYDTPEDGHGFTLTPSPRRPYLVRLPSGYTSNISPQIPPRVVTQGLGESPNPGGNGNRNAQFDYKCTALNEKESQESSTHHSKFTQKSKTKKKRNQHLD